MTSRDKKYLIIGFIIFTLILVIGNITYPNLKKSFNKYDNIQDKSNISNNNQKNEKQNNSNFSNQETNNVNSVSVSKQNAIKKAQSYLKYSAFSKQSLIEQLEFEKFSNEDAIFAVDSLNVNWNEQAIKKAESYLKYSAFSKQGLIEQLEFEGFTYDQALYGTTQNGL